MNRREATRRLRWGGAVAAVLATLSYALAPVPASAHTGLVSSDPADGARLAAFPEQVVLEFTEELSPPAYMIVTGPDGSSLVRGDVQIDGARLLLPTEASTEEGQYTIAFRVVSADGHPISGQVRPVVGEAPPQESPGTGTSVPPPNDEEPAPEVGIADDRDQRQGGGGTRTAWAVGVGASLFGIAGVLALLARRSRS